VLTKYVLWRGGTAITCNIVHVWEVIAVVDPNVGAHVVVDSVVRAGGPRWAGRMVIKRLINPRDIAALAVFLASDAAKSISGQVLPIDGDFQRF
jgi:NAD(P)-dependent dehydrogenase (short-subunit alcohol dehydrogenase family)